MIMYDSMAYISHTKEVIHATNLSIDGVTYGNVLLDSNSNDTVAKKVFNYIESSNTILPIEETNFKLTTTDIIKAINNSVKTKLDQVAIDRGYDSAISIASYANSTIQAFKDEATKFITYRDSVWDAINKYLNKSGDKSLDEAMEVIPAFNWED